MSPVEAAGLFVALTAPALALLVVVLERSPWAVHRTVRAGAMASAAAWVVVLLAGARGRAALLHLTPLVAAGGCGAALVAAAVLDVEQASRRALVGTGVALVLACLGLAGGREGVQVVVLAGAMALAAVVAVDAAPPEDRAAPALLALLGTVAALVGAGALLVGDDRWDLPETGAVSRAAIVALVGAGAAWAAAATVPPRRATALLLPGGLVLGLAAAPLRSGEHDVAVAAGILAVVATAAALAGRRSMALALLALAAASASPGLAPSSRLLAAAAVLVAASGDRPVALLAALPGGVALAAGVIDDGGWLAAVLALAGVGVAALLGRTVAAAGEGEPSPGPATLGLVPAALVGAWLLGLPGSWTWTGAELGHYDRGMARGLAAAGAAVAVAALAPRLAPRLVSRLGPRQGRGRRRRP